MAITEQERLQIVDEVVNKIKDESQGVNELPEVSSLDGLKSLPAMKGTQVVAAPISLLAKEAADTLRPTINQKADSIAVKADLDMRDQQIAAQIEAVRVDMPSAQTARVASATAGRYVYSTDCDNAGQSTAVMAVKNTGFVQSGGQLKFVAGVWDPAGSTGSKKTLSALQIATPSCAGVMSGEDKTKLDGYPAARTATETTWGLMGADHARKLAACWPNVYGRTDSVRRAVNGIFSLTTASTAAQIEAALTEYSTKAVLTPLELENCAANGMQLYDEATQAFVTVTHNGGGMFNFIELSAANYGQLPRLRFCSLLLTADTKRVKRPGQEERLCFKSELDAMQTQLNTLMETLRNNGTI